MCGVFAETEVHLLVSCQFAWSCWEFSGLATASREPLTLLSWLEESANRVDNEALCKIVMLCWALWSARNDLIWQQHVRTVRDVVVFANSRLDQYLKAQGRGISLCCYHLKKGVTEVVVTAAVTIAKMKVEPAATVDAKNSLAEKMDQIHLHAYKSETIVEGIGCIRVASVISLPPFVSLFKSSVEVAFASS
uniref:Reverse transcriptase zinc-binding domain-containing protein n=1 Tax=Cannabis sativa TaxID=3483 RepID=A0A803NNW2_CANSA